MGAPPKAYLDRITVLSAAAEEESRFWVAMTYGGARWEVRDDEGYTLAECREREHAEMIASALNERKEDGR